MVKSVEDHKESNSDHWLQIGCVKSHDPLKRKVAGQCELQPRVGFPAGSSAVRLSSDDAPPPSAPPSVSCRDRAPSAPRR